MTRPGDVGTIAGETFQAVAEAVDRAIAEADRLDGPARQAALQLRAALERFHKVGLSLMVSRLKADPAGKELLLDLLDEPEHAPCFPCTD